MFLKSRVVFRNLALFPFESALLLSVLQFTNEPNLFPILGERLGLDSLVSPTGCRLLRNTLHVGFAVVADIIDGSFFGFQFRRPFFSNDSNGVVFVLNHPTQTELDAFSVLLGE